MMIELILKQKKELKLKFLEFNSIYFEIFACEH